MNAKILVVEDELGQREALAEVLSRLGYEVQCAANGSEALELMRHSESLPGLILLDLMMPVMDGWEFRAAQRKDRAIGHSPTCPWWCSRRSAILQTKPYRMGPRPFCPSLSAGKSCFR